MSYTRLKSGILIPNDGERRPRPSALRNRSRWSPTQGLGAVLDPDGSVAWQDPDWQDNALIDEGEQSMLNVYLGAQTNPSKYLVLINGGTVAPVETSTMSYLGQAAGQNETQVPAANGYNRQQIVNGIAGADWTDDGLISTDWRFSAAQKTFGPASGSAWTATHAGLVTAATGQTAGSGKFLLFLPLSGSTTINIGQSFVYILRWTQQ